MIQPLAQISAPTRALERLYRAGAGAAVAGRGRREGAPPHPRYARRDGVGLAAGAGPGRDRLCAQARRHARSVGRGQPDRDLVRQRGARQRHAGACGRDRRLACAVAQPSRLRGGAGGAGGGRGRTRERRAIPARGRARLRRGGAAELCARRRRLRVRRTHDPQLRRHLRRRRGGGGAARRRCDGRPVISSPIAPSRRRASARACATPTISRRRSISAACRRATASPPPPWWRRASPASTTCSAGSAISSRPTGPSPIRASSPHGLGQQLRNSRHQHQEMVGGLADPVGDRRAPASDGHARHHGRHRSSRSRCICRPARTAPSTAPRRRMSTCSICSPCC